VTTKACLYARVSTPGQDPEVQLGALRTHATQRGWQVVEEYVDRGVSGAKERRPALDGLRKAAWAGHFPHTGCVDMANAAKNGQR